MNFTFSDEDVKLVEKFIEIRNRGFYVSGEEVTNEYNRILNKRVSPTNCSACLKARISELETALNAFKRAIELEKKQEPTPIKEEENKAVRKPKNKK
jgi:hypothetical protein